MTNCVWMNVVLMFRLRLNIFLLIGGAMFNRRTARAKLAAIAKALTTVGAKVGDPRYTALGGVLADASSSQAFGLDAHDGRLVVMALDLYNVLGGEIAYDEEIAGLFGECEKAYFRTYGQKWA
ncbi:MAG: hypothetical protein K2X44_02300 [Magnetospirillum sp.]|nr:hypothetical protein [Magnetospirillum sp.]